MAATCGCGPASPASSTFQPSIPAPLSLTIIGPQTVPREANVSGRLHLLAVSGLGPVQTSASTLPTDPPIRRRDLEGCLRSQTDLHRRGRANGPYMHDGSFARLEDVVEFYSEGGRPNAYVDAEIRPRNFTAEEKRALVALLRSVSGRVKEGLR